MLVKNIYNCAEDLDKHMQMKKPEWLIKIYKMFHLICNQRTANKKHNEIPPHTHQTGPVLKT